MFAVWVNLHARWLQGLGTMVVIVAAVLATQYRRRVFGRGAVTDLPPGALALVLLAWVGALSINPYGPRLVTFPLEMQAAWIRARVFEWQWPFDNPGWQLTGGGQFVPLLFLLHHVYLAGLFGVLGRAVTRWRTRDFLPVAVMSLWGLLGLWHLRTAADMALVTGPLVTASWTSPSWKTRRWPPRLKRTCRPRCGPTGR
jgi:hypothetical protein